MTEEKIQQADVHLAAPGCLSALRAASKVSARPELKPCPFCGGTDIFIQEETMEWPAETWKVFGYTIGCNLHTGCGITHFAETREAAIAAWNRRAPSGDASMEDGA